MCNRISFLSELERRSKGSPLIGIREVRQDIELWLSIVDGDVADRKVIDFLPHCDPFGIKKIQFEFAVWFSLTEG